MGIRGVQFKMGKGCHYLDGSFILATVFRGQDGCPLSRLKGQDHGFWREVSLGEGPGASSCLVLSSESIGRGRFLTGSWMLTMEECHSFSPPLSLCTFSGLGHSPSGVSYWMYQVPIFKGVKCLKWENAKKKKSLKSSHKSRFWHFRKTAKKT